MTKLVTIKELTELFNSYINNKSADDIADQDFVKELIKAKERESKKFYNKISSFENKKAMSEDRSAVLNQKCDGDVCLIVEIDPPVALLFDNEQNATNVLRQALGDENNTTSIWEMSKNESPQKLSFVLRNNQLLVESLKLLITEFFDESPHLYNRNNDTVFIQNKVYQNRENALEKFSEFKNFLLLKDTKWDYKVHIDQDCISDITTNAVLRLLPELEKIGTEKALKEKLIQGSDIKSCFFRNPVIQEGKFDCVYVVTNKFFEKENLYKIGHTNNLSRRISQFNTSSPDDFICVYYKVSADRQRLETLVHQTLQKYRYRSDREYFQLKLDEIIKTIESIRT